MWSFVIGGSVAFFGALFVNLLSSARSRQSTKDRVQNRSSEPNTVLPNGLRLYTNGSWGDIQCVYREIFEWESYCNEQRFIQLNDQSTIFDIGSNSGMFAVYLLRRFPNARLHCFEPIPETYALCEKNIRLYAGDRWGKSVFCHQLALSNRNGQAAFTFNPFLSVAAGISSEHDALYAVGKKHGVAEWMNAVLVDISSLIQSTFLKNLLKSFAKLFLHRIIGPILLVSLIPYFVYSILSKALHSRLFEQSVECKLETLTDFLSRQRDIQKIDFVKLDVEGSEMDVLMGIDEKVWKKIHQMAIEVHDVEGRVEKMKKLLVQNGFEIKVEQEDWETHKLLDIYTIFARRIQ